MRKAFSIIAGLMILGCVTYVYLRELALPSPAGCSPMARSGKCPVELSSSSSASSSSPMPSARREAAYSVSSRQMEATPGVAVVEQTSVKNAVAEKYAILFALLQLSEHDQLSLHNLLLQREQVLSRQFYDSRSNEAEVAANLRKRDEDVAEVDRNIEMLLSATDIQKFRLLKDSTYEQAQLNGFYELAGAETTLTANHKAQLLLAKLAQKQSAAREVKDALDNIKNAASSTRPYLIEKVHQGLIDQKEAYLSNAKALLTEDQFNLLREYEQQLFDERWRDIKSGLESE